jgi:hypothetical protein
VKSIELGNYKCAGHLVKMIVKKTEVLLLKQALWDLHNELNNTKTFNGQEFMQFCNTIDKKLVNDFMISIPFSSVSFNYCFSKLVLILFFQHKFIFDTKDHVFEYEEFGFETNKSYVYDKIVDLHKEYGLVVLKDEHIKKLNASPRI